MMSLQISLLIFCSVISAQKLEKESGQFPNNLAKQLQTAIDNWTKDPAHGGVSAAVILKNNDEWFSTAGKQASGKDLSNDHLIWIASITKSMTGSIILKLAEESKLNLDDPISLWFNQTDNVDPAITIRQLLNHTNGLANYTLNPKLGSVINSDTSHVFTSTELVSYIGKKSFNAGEKTQYTNTAFILLGIIAEKVSGKTIVELYHEIIWGPLSLKDIFLPGYESPTGPVADAWVRNPVNNQIVSPMNQMSLLTIGYSAFGLFSNAKTVARWGRALFSESFFAAKTRKSMLEFVPAAGNIPGESGAGLGIRKYNFLDREQWGHSGGSPLGSSLMIYDPKTEIIIAVLMNQGGHAHHFDLAPKLLEIVSKGDHR